MHNSFQPQIDVRFSLRFRWITFLIDNNEIEIQKQTDIANNWVIRKIAFFCLIAKTEENQEDV